LVSRAHPSSKTVEGAHSCEDGAPAGGPRTLDLSPLTRREAEVLLLLADGQPNRTLARRLGIAERTLRAHITSLSRKLGIGSRLEAALLAARHREFFANGDGPTGDRPPSGRSATPGRQH
jgi:two-component system nitrate/nitrite response regulator NarL